MQAMLSSHNSSLPAPRIARIHNSSKVRRKNGTNIIGIGTSSVTGRNLKNRRSPRIVRGKRDNERSGLAVGRVVELVVDGSLGEQGAGELGQLAGDVNDGRAHGGDAGLGGEADVELAVDDEEVLVCAGVDVAQDDAAGAEGALVDDQASVGEDGEAL
jgi:hypothetical protein